MNKNIDNSTMIGKRLELARKDAKLSREKLAEKIAAGVSSIKNWEAGNNIPPVDKVAAICNALHISADPILATGEYRVKDTKEELDGCVYPDAFSGRDIENLLNEISDLKLSDKRIVFRVAAELAKQLRTCH